MSNSVLREFQMELVSQLVSLPQSISRELSICFVQTPIVDPFTNETGTLQNLREAMLYNFDKRYLETHQDMRKQADSLIWEIPHWCTWLGGILEHVGFHDQTLFFEDHKLVDIEQPVPSIEGVIDEADVYLFSPMVPNLYVALEYARMLKEMFPECVTIMGGLAVSPLKEEVARDPNVDFVVFGRGDYALPILLDLLEQYGMDDCRLGQMQNLCFERNGDLFVSNSEYAPISPCELPFPKLDLLDPSFGSKVRFIRQVFGLGCPYNCSFCSIQTRNSKKEYFDLDRVIEEIKAYRAHFDDSNLSVYFGDETFTLSKDRTIEICERLSEEGIGSYDIQTRINHLDDQDILLALKESGCNWVEVGIESLADGAYSDHKGTEFQVQEIERVLDFVASHDLPVCSFMINGLPTQSLGAMESSIMRVCDFIDRGLLQASYYFGLVPYPGSDLYDNPEKYGIKILHHKFKYYNEELAPCYDSRLADSESIFDLYRQGVAEIGKSMGSI